MRAGQFLPFFALVCFVFTKCNSHVDVKKVEQTSIVTLKETKAENKPEESKTFKLLQGK